MPTLRIAKYGGWAALAAGSLEILGLLFLILFFALELPQGAGSSLRFGYLSDVTPIIAAPVDLVVVLVMFLLLRKPAPALSVLAALLGTAGILLTAWTNLSFVSGEITLEQQVQWFYISLIFLGPWHILVNSAARKTGSLPRRLTAFGTWVGAGQIILSLASFMPGGNGQTTSLSLADIMQNTPLLIALAMVVPMSLLGYLGAPVWLVWLARVLTAHSLAPSKPMLEINGT